VSKGGPGIDIMPRPAMNTPSAIDHSMVNASSQLWRKGNEELRGGSGR